MRSGNVVLALERPWLTTSLGSLNRQLSSWSPRLARVIRELLPCVPSTRSSDSNSALHPHQGQKADRASSSAAFSSKTMFALASRASLWLFKPPSGPCGRLQGLFSRPSNTLSDPNYVTLPMGTPRSTTKCSQPGGCSHRTSPIATADAYPPSVGRLPPSRPSRSCVFVLSWCLGVLMVCF